MFEKVSVAITEVLEDKKIIQSSTKEVCAYGLRQIFSTIFNAGTMLLIGFLMQMLIEAILFTVIYIPVRVYAGGYHASTPQRCWAFSAIMLWIALCIVKYTPQMYFWVITTLSLIACIVVFLLSPVEDRNKRLDEKEHHVYPYSSNCCDDNRSRCSNPAVCLSLQTICSGIGNRMVFSGSDVAVGKRKECF